MYQSVVKYLLFSVLLFTVSCKTHYQTTAVEYKDYRINSKPAADNALNQLLKPYSDSVNKSMNDVIAVASTTLEKKFPEGSLGNLLADIMLNKAIEKFKVPVDAAFLNAGGIRLPSIAAGNITRGKIFELSPFDNIIVLLTIKGSTLQQFLDTTANKGGWPVSGCTYQLKNKRAINITIGGKPLQPGAEYTIATLDYVANGGDNCDMLKTIPQQTTGYVFREAVLDYCKQMQAAGRQITSKIENRVTHAE